MEVETLSSICVMALKWLSSFIRASPGAIARRMSISFFAKSRTLRRDARFVSIWSAAGGAAASPLPVSLIAPAAKFANTML